MEVLAAVVGSLMTELCRILFSSIHAKIDNFLNFQSYFTDLDKEMKGLTERRDAVNEELQAEKREGLVPRPQVQDWLRQVREIEAEIISLKETSGGCCCYRYCSSKKILENAVLEKLTDVKRLVQASSFPSGVPAQVIVEHIPGPSIGDQPTAAGNMAELMDMLNDDEVRRIGVWGMGGVGKTTLVKNVNNKLEGAPSTPFTIIIWVTVSKRSEESSYLKRVQKQIANRLKVDLNANEDITESVSIQLHERLKNEKFLLILDDVWDPIDLDTVGVPRPEAYPGTKILLTTRLSEVCGGMMTDKIVRVEVLNEEEAWRLFCKHAGEVATSKHVETFAKAITRECCGLPLAIIVVGASMRGKKKVEQWENALGTLQRSEPKIRGIESRVYNPLKWSYDSLSDKGIKFCFLFCCLYPEDYSIPVDELVRYWFAEGLLDENQSLEEVRSQGITILENLKDSCLLEKGVTYYWGETVKMHDVVRDVAIWIASNLEEECKSVTMSQLGPKSISNKHLLKSARRLSFMNNEIDRVPDECMTECPLASTLLLQGNYSLEDIPYTFLEAFQCLTVLDVSKCKIKSLPLSLNKLVKLRALILSNCVNLEELPPVGKLGKLLLLDCSGTSIEILPEGMNGLTSLRRLNLSEIRSSSTRIRVGDMAKLFNLEILKMSRGTGQWVLDDKAGDYGRTPFEEMLLLERLVAWNIDLKSIPCTVSPIDVALMSSIKKIKQFLVCIGGGFPQFDTLDALPRARPVSLKDQHFSGEWIGWLFLNATHVCLSGCEGLNLMFQEIAMYSDFVGSFDCLSKLEIVNSDSSFQRTEGYTLQQFDLLPNLETLYLSDLTKLTSISELAELLGLKLARLRQIKIINCPRLKCLLSLDSSRQGLGQLTKISLDLCVELEELFRNDSTNSPSQTLVSNLVFPKFELMSLKNLPKLQTFCRRSPITCPVISKLKVINCHLLTKLPVTIPNADTVKEIRGQRRWWQMLEWDNNDEFKSSLECVFVPFRIPMVDP